MNFNQSNSSTAPDAVVHSHSLLRAIPLLEARSEPTLILAPDSLIILEANQSMTAILGANGTQLVGRSVLQWIAEEHRIDFFRAVRSASRHAFTSAIPFLWRSKNTSAFHPLLTRAWPLQLSAQQFVIELSTQAPLQSAALSIQTLEPLPHAAKF